MRPDHYFPKHKLESNFIYIIMIELMNIIQYI